MHRGEMIGGGTVRATLGSIGFMREQTVVARGTRNARENPSVGAGMQGFVEALDGIERVRSGYESLVESILGGNRSAAESVKALFVALTGGGRKAHEELAGSFEAMTGQIFAGMGDYAKRLGVLSGLAAKAFAALRSMNPFAAAAASVALIAIGQALKGLAGSVGKGGGSGGVAANGTGSAGSSSGGGISRPVNIYINGLRSAAPYAVERVLDRAGVDRDLRERFRELVRTGANPALDH